MARHVNSVTTHPPKTGARAGDSEKIMLTNASNLVAPSAHPSAAKANASRARRITRLRPKASDKGPCIKLIQAKASK